MNKWNHYICSKCGKITIARHDDEGVTPFIIGCHASDEVTNTTRVRVCRGQAESCFFNCDQSDTQIPHVIFYRPKNVMEAIDAIKKEPEKAQQWLIEHYSKGGSLMRFNDIITG